MADSSSTTAKPKVIATSRPISKEANLDPRSTGSKNMDLFDDINNRENNEASSVNEHVTLTHFGIIKGLDYAILP